MGPSKRSMQYTQNGVLFVPSFLPPAVLSQVQEGCRRMRGGMKREKDSLARNRMGRHVDRRSEVHRLLTSSAMVNRVSGLVGHPMEPSVYPIELRSYGVGSGMDWHHDDPLYETPQCELVLCIDNTSDSRTAWIDAAGVQHAEWTPPNAALLIRAGASGPAHRVLPVKVGMRTIVKMVWAVPGAAPLDSFGAHIDSLPGRRGLAAKAVRRGRTARRRR